MVLHLHFIAHMSTENVYIASSEYIKLLRYFLCLGVEFHWVQENSQET